MAIGYSRLTHCGSKVYRVIKVGKGQYGWAREHRYVMEQLLGRKLARNEHVHHKDGNTLNNAPENLVVLSAADHNREHFVLPDTQWSKLHASCIECGTTERRHISHGMCSACYQRWYARLSADGAAPAPPAC